jgi:peroxiredoxin
MKLRSILASLAFVAACSKPKPAPVEPAQPIASTQPTTEPGEPPAPMPEPATPQPADQPAAAPTHNAIVGKAAPDFTLKDVTGKDVSLASFKGKTVVLEWFNPGCPFVKNAHGKGSLVDAAKRHTANGVVWLAINSAGPGKQGADLKLNVDAAKTWTMTHPILRDDTGTVGKAYGATNTPHMFVIDRAGMVVYAGAIDNSPDGEGQAAKDGKLVNHVDAALAALAAGKPVEVADTKAYGCSVKYGS